ncbi:MAG: hypothetical protein AB1657_01475 [Candidatus Micrarchaeota archaeon]
MEKPSPGKTSGLKPTNRHAPIHNPRFALLLAPPLLAIPSNADARAVRQSPPRPPQNNPQNAAPLPAPQSIPYEGGTFTCSFENNRLRLIFEKPDGTTETAEPDVLPLSMLGRIYATICGEYRTIIISENYATVTLGARDVAEGRRNLVRDDGQEAFFSAYGLEMPHDAGIPKESFVSLGALFLLHGNNSLFALPLGNFSTRFQELEVDGANSSSARVEAMGMLFFIQPGAVPVSTVAFTNGRLENQAFDAPEGVELRSLLRVEDTEEGIRAVFNTPDGEKAINIRAEEGNLDSVVVSTP